MVTKPIVIDKEIISIRETLGSLRKLEITFVNREFGMSGADCGIVHAGDPYLVQIKYFDEGFCKGTLEIPYLFYIKLNKIDRRRNPIG